ncbi:MAG: CmcI family methyltransferase [Bryobacteraceae bacterium]|nr:CmcI family methyltransferase [Bryobacteraceae bacterium]
MLPTEQQLSMYRTASKDPQIAVYRTFVPGHVLGVIDQVIDGPYFVGVSDTAALSMLALYVKLRPARNILELGTFGGLSAIVMASCLDANDSSARLTTVDLSNKHQHDSRPHIQAASLEHKISLISGSSTDAEVVNTLRRLGPFDMIYIDSSHAYKQTLEELDLYTGDQALSSSATAIFMHDAGRSAASSDPTGEGGVPRAVQEWMQKNGAHFQFLSLEPPVWPNPCGLGMLLRK